LGNANAGDAIKVASFIIRKVFDEKIFYCSIFESSRGKLQEYLMKNMGFLLKNSK